MLYQLNMIANNIVLFVEVSSDKLHLQNLADLIKAELSRERTRGKWLDFAHARLLKCSIPVNEINIQDLKIDKIPQNVLVVNARYENYYKCIPICTSTNYVKINARRTEIENEVETRDGLAKWDDWCKKQAGRQYSFYDVEVLTVEEIE